MNFVVEFLPKKVDGQLCYVVRAANGFPLGVVDTLDEVVDLMNEKYEEMAKYSNQSNSL